MFQLSNAKAFKDRPPPSLFLVKNWGPCLNLPEHQKGYNDVIHSRDVECSVCESALFSMQHGSFELSHSQTRVLHNL